MKLSHAERLILANQYRMLEALDPEDAAFYEEARTIVEHGYELHYRGLPGPVLQETLSSDECREVLDILSMFTALNYSYEKLPDKAGIEPQHIQFLGFDGNNETKQMTYARFYCLSGGGRFPEVSRGDDFNSHFPMLPQYRRMLAEWKKSEDTNQLSAEDILRITSEQARP